MKLPPLTTHNLPFLENPFYTIGPSLDAGPAPTLFYFCAAGKQTLSSSPFVDPLLALDDCWRVLSISLPFHEEGQNNRDALQNFWLPTFEQSPFFLEAFLQQLDQLFHYGLEQQWWLPGEVAAAGLSRGGFIATHLAARHAEISTILGYAPLTSLERCQPLELIAQCAPEALRYNLSHLVPSLIRKKIFYLIGNRDQAVSTQACFNFLDSLVEAAFEQGIRSPSFELRIRPSMGHLGHGTSPEAFIEGIRWLEQQL